MSSRPMAAMVVVVALAGAAWPAPAGAGSDEDRDKACAAPDMVNRVTGGEFCLAIRTYGTDAAGPAPTLVIVLHGDMSSGGAPEYHMGVAERLAGAGVVAVGLIRPGYEDKLGRRSDGSSSRSDHYTAENVDSVADAVARLKAHYRAAATVVIGHSGGAAIAGVLIGRRPGVADRALLISCPCDIPRWRDLRGRSAWDLSLSPLDYADKVPPGMTVIAVTGEKDNNAYPELARAYVAKLAARGVAARFVAVPGAGHRLNRRFQESREFAAALKAIAGGGR